MIRVLMTADTLGGVWTYAIDLVRELSRHSIEVALATLGRPMDREQRELARSIPGLEVFESSYRLEWMRDAWDDVERSRDWLMRLAGEISPDVVHLNDFSHAQLDWKVPRIVVAHSDVFSWYSAVKKQSPPSEWSRYHSEVASGLRAADLVIAPSKAMMDDLRRFYDVPLQETRIIPNGRSTTGFEARPKKDFILSVGRLWDEAKNILALDQIATRLPFPVLAAGSLDDPDGRKTHTRGVRALGQLSQAQLRELFAEASIYALPARYEPFGLSVLEAAICGCALVLGDIPSLRENWQNAAIFVRPDEPESLQEALMYLIRNPEIRSDYSQRARERSRFFGAKRMASFYKQEYQRLAASILPLSQDQFIPERRSG